MREDTLYPTTQLGHDLCHAFASLSKGGSMDVGLRRDTAYIEAGSSDLSALEDCNLQALFGSIFSGAVTTRPRTDDNQICGNHISHLSSFI